MLVAPTKSNRILDELRLPSWDLPLTKEGESCISWYVAVLGAPSILLLYFDLSAAWIDTAALYRGVQGWYLKTSPVACPGMF